MIESLGLLDDSFSYQARGTSMLPTIGDGDVVTILPDAPASVGDVVAVRIAGELVCHRVVELRADGSLVTHGDNAAAPDAPCPGADVVGKVVAIRRASRRPPLGWLVRTLKSFEPARPLLAAVVARLCRYSVALPAPVKSVAAYSFVELGRRPRPLPEGALVVARVFGRVAARLDPATGVAVVHDALEGLGLEAELSRRWNASR